MVTTWYLMVFLSLQEVHAQNCTMKTTKSVKLMKRPVFSTHYRFLENLKRQGKIPLCAYEVLASWFNFLESSPLVNLDVY